jgi:hypothetical protein
VSRDLDKRLAAGKAGYKVPGAFRDQRTVVSCHCFQGSVNRFVSYPKEHSN